MSSQDAVATAGLSRGDACLRSRASAIARGLLAQVFCSVAVFSCGWLTLTYMTAADGMTMPMWTGSGLALAMMWLGGIRLWPSIAIGLLLSTIATDRAVLAPSVTLGSVLEAIAGITLLRAVNFRISLTRTRDALALMALATTIGPLVTATITFTTTWAFSGPLAAPDAPSFVPPGMTPLEFSVMAARYTWIGDAVGELLIAPTILVWAGVVKGGMRLRLRRSVEAAALSIALLVSALFAFGAIEAGPVKREYVIFPVLFWAALRFGPQGATLSMLVVQTALIWLTLHNLGPFASGSAAIDPGMIQTFAVISAASVLLLATTSKERQAASEEAGRLRAETRFAKIVEHISDMVLVLDPRGHLTYFNAAVARVLGYSAAELSELARPRSVHPQLPPVTGFFSLLHPDDVDILQGYRTLESREGQVTSREVRLMHADRSWRTLELTTQYLRHNPVINGVIVCARDVTERKQAQDALKRLALYDPLTELPNRTLLQERLAHALDAAARNGNGFSLVMCDLDRFKEVNDTLGHQAGDALLREVAIRMSTRVRSADMIARLGGDEFALLLSSVEDEETARNVVQDIVTVLEEPFVIEGATIGVAASAGIAVYPAHGRDASSLLRAADIAMYAAKRAHLGVACYSSEQSTATSGELALFADLRAAIATGELVLHYQPKVDLASGETESVEALVRWDHPGRGLLPPSEFIPLAERSGLMPALTRCVAEAAFRQLRLWREDGLDLAVAINLSPSSLTDADLPRDIVRLIETYGVSPHQVIVEVTETAIIEDHARAFAALTFFRTAGVRISVDDFGAGQSSLTYLKALPIDELKIDRGFVHDMLSSRHDAAIVGAVIDLGHRLGLRVTAEGVEQRAEWDALSNLGCDLAQGFLMARPLPPERLRAWCDRHKPRSAPPAYLSAHGRMDLDAAA